MSSRTRRDLGWGLYWSGVANLACVAVLNNNPRGAPSPREWLVTLSALNELIGVVLIASPELGRHAPRFFRSAAQRVRDALRLVGSRVRRWLRRSPRGRAVSIGVAEEISVADTIRAQTSPGAGASTEERVQYLLREVKRLDDRIHGLEVAVPAQAAELRAELSEAEQRLRAEIERSAETIADTRIELRLLGVAYVVLGIVLAWFGNVVS